MRERALHPERGAAAVEFALLLPVLFLVIAAIVDFGRFFYTQNVTVNAAREGARMLALGYPKGDMTASPPTNPSAALRVKQAMISIPQYDATYSYVAANGTSSPAPTSTSACPATPAPGDHVTVTVRADTFSFLVLGPAFKILGGTVTQPIPSGTADVRCGG